MPVFFMLLEQVEQIVLRCLHLTAVAICRAKVKDRAEFVHAWRSVFLFEQLEIAVAAGRRGETASFPVNPQGAQATRLGLVAGRSVSQGQSHIIHPDGQGDGGTVFSAAKAFRLVKARPD